MKRHLNNLQVAFKQVFACSSYIALASVLALAAFLSAIFVGPAALAHADQAALLYEKTSPYNTIIVTEENGFRVLRFERDGPRQSLVKPGDPDYLGLPYARAALAGLALSEEPGRILVVGLGGGTLPMFLHKYYPEAAIDAVDIDPDVVRVAKDFFGFREDPHMKAHVSDGRRFLEDTRQPYDVIFLDAFDARAVPAHMTTQEFLRAVRRAVKPGGVVIGNIWGRGSNPLYDSMVRTYREVFDELFVLAAPGSSNRILLALPRKQPLTREEFARLARKVSAGKRFRFDLGDVVERGFLHAHGKDRDGRVLRDRNLEQRKPRSP